MNMSKRGHTKKPSQMADDETGRLKPEAKRMAAENMKNGTNMRKNRKMNNMTIGKMQKMNGTPERHQRCNGAPEQEQQQHTNSKHSWKHISRTQLHTHDTSRSTRTRNTISRLVDDILPTFDPDVPMCVCEIIRVYTYTEVVSERFSPPSYLSFYFIIC